MKIGIQTWGSDGDINPFIALAGALSRAGHEVTLAITSAERKNYDRFAERLGFKLGTVDYMCEGEDAFYLIAQKFRASSNPMKQMEVIMDDMFAPDVHAMYGTALALCSENDLIIGHFIHYPLQAAAEKTGKPYLTVTLNHGGIPTRYAPPPPLPNLGGTLNRLLWWVAAGLLNRIILPRANRFRNAHGLAPARSYRDLWESPVCNLIAVSREFCEPKPDFGSHQKVCGFFRNAFQNDAWVMPERLARFMEGGEPPVYLTFGSMTAAQNDVDVVTESARLLIEAARSAGCRAIIQAHWANVSDIPRDERIFCVDTLPHEKIFPLCSAVVHHGGAGTTQTATLCGCPSVVVAHIADQYLWGSELKRLGIAPKVIDRRTATPEKIARQLRKVFDTPAMGERAKMLGERLRNEDGLKSAVEAIESLKKATKPSPAG